MSNFLRIFQDRATIEHCRKLNTLLKFFVLILLSAFISLVYRVIQIDRRPPRIVISQLHIISTHSGMQFVAYSWTLLLADLVTSLVRRQICWDYGLFIINILLLDYLLFRFLRNLLIEHNLHLWRVISVQHLLIFLSIQRFGIHLNFQIWITWLVLISVILLLRCLNLL